MILKVSYVKPDTRVSYFNSKSETDTKSKPMQAVILTKSFSDSLPSLSESNIRKHRFSAVS